MKKLLVFFGIIFVAFFATNCVKTTKVLTETPKPQISTAEKRGPTYYIQSLLSGINSKDSVLVYQNAIFFNSCEIKLEKYLSDQAFFVDEKGSVLKIDTITEAQKIVPALTPGKQVSIRVSRNYKGVIMVVNVSFSNNDANYQFSFWRTDDGRFMLNGNAIITVNEHPYKVIAKTTTACYLMFNFGTKIVPKTIKSEAEGINGAASSNLKPTGEENKPKEIEGFQPSYIATPIKQ